MKPISIKAQKIIMYIPGINIFCIVIWLYNSFFYDENQSTLKQSLLIIFTSAVPLAVLQTALGFYFPKIGEVLGVLNSYLIPLFIGYRLVKYQEKIM